MTKSYFGIFVDSRMQWGQASCFQNAGCGVGARCSNRWCDFQARILGYICRATFIGAVFGIQGWRAFAATAPKFGFACPCIRLRSWLMRVLHGSGVLVSGFALLQNLTSPLLGSTTKENARLIVQTHSDFACRWQRYGYQWKSKQTCERDCSLAYLWGWESKC